MSRNQIKTVRCAIYTRKSTDEGLEKDFNSLDAQRESGEAYIASQRHEGWECLPTGYDDGGFSGGNMDRPALKRLLADVEAGKVDCMVVYKVDRLSRSLLDFARLLESFDKHQVAFVSVTQAFSTTSSIGRLTLNMLLSFAQFEREVISERTRDKIAATRRKGKWSGGRPVLGYDVVDGKLVVNEAEACQVRKIFELYARLEAVIPTIRELDQRGWRTERWTMRNGEQRGGTPFDKSNLIGLLKNVLYVGRVKYKDEVHAGEHRGVVEPKLFERVQALLRRNHQSGGAEVRNGYGALLRGLLRCVPCGCAMTHTHTKKDGARRYRYYVCVRAQKRGWESCPSQSIPAPEIERFVVDQIRGIGRDPGLIAETLAQVRKQVEDQTIELEREQHGHRQDLAQFHGEMRGLLGDPARNASRTTARLADLQERIANAERRLTELETELEGLRDQVVDDDQITEVLARFAPVWESLTRREQARVIQLLIEPVEYDGESGEIAITFRPTGIQTLAAEITQQQETAA